MNLLQFRQFFRKHSGRFDLVNADGSDNGANDIINQGQKYLDRLVDIPAGVGRVFVDVGAGDFLVKFKHCRAILEVWCIGANDSGTIVRLPLTKHRQEDLRGIDKATLEEGYTGIASSIAQSRPVLYTPSQLRLVNSDNNNAGVGGMMDVLADGFQVYNGIFLMPPSDGDYSIEVIGNFYTITMSEDTDSTFWSEQHFMILYMATMRQLEVIHRNTDGVKDWESTIMADVTTIDMDGVTEESSGVNQMGG